MKQKITLALGLCLLYSATTLASSGGFTPEENKKLQADYPMPSGEMLGDNCSACHGTRGAEFNEAMPPLAGMNKDNFIKLMKDFRANAFPTIVMHDVAFVFSDAEIEAMATFFANQKAQEWTQPNWNQPLEESLNEKNN